MEQRRVHQFVIEYLTHYGLVNSTCECCLNEGQVRPASLSSAESLACLQENS
jgi:hypothetical protein